MCGNCNKAGTSRQKPGHGRRGRALAGASAAATRRDSSHACRRLRSGALTGPVLHVARSASVRIYLRHTEPPAPDAKMWSFHHPALLPRSPHMRRTLLATAAAFLALFCAALGAQAQSSAAASGSSSVSIPASAPDGSISMIKPGQSGDASYYKIAQGNKISFAWNYSDVIITPSTLLISAFCTANAVTYDLGGVDGHSTEFVFDPYEYNQNAPKSQLPPLMQASYKLMITNPDATASAPGVAAGNSKVTFAMYNPQAYTPLSGVSLLFSLQRKADPRLCLQSGHARSAAAPADSYLPDH